MRNNGQHNYGSARDARHQDHCFEDMRCGCREQAERATHSAASRDVDVLTLSCKMVSLPFGEGSFTIEKSCEWGSNRKWKTAEDTQPK
jgi:hypothetical protein